MIHNFPKLYNTIILNIKIHILLDIVDTSEQIKHIKLALIKNNNLFIQLNNFK